MSKRCELFGSIIKLKPGVAEEYCMNENCEEVIGRVIEVIEVTADYISLKFQPTKVKKGLCIKSATKHSWWVNSAIVKGGYTKIKVLKGGPR